MLHVVKADGTLEEFSEEKVLRSIKRAGVPPELQQKVLQSITSKLYDNIPTHDIYTFITQALETSDQPFSKARYSLKQAIMMLGPSGYPFEDFVSRVLQDYGYTAQTRQLLLGKCISHEIDIVAQKNDKKILIEAKFHNNSGTRSEVQVPLYIKSRFDDLKDRHDFAEAWLVTNTKATTDAIAYANCVGMHVMSWNYPDSGSLRAMIEEKNLHPVTMLSSLSLPQKAHLLANHILLCKDILDNPKLLHVLDLGSDVHQKVMDELSYIDSTHDHSD